LRPNMPLNLCLKCGEKLSAGVVACPHCGGGISTSTSRNQTSGVSRLSHCANPKLQPGSILAISCSALMFVGLLVGFVGLLLIIFAYVHLLSEPNSEVTEYYRAADALLIEAGFLLCLIGGMIGLIASILFLIWLYRAWSVVPPGYHSPSPGRAVGWLFIPLFNLYWIFRVIPGLSATLQRVLRDRDPSRPHSAGFGLGVATCVIAFIPFLNAISILLFPIWIYLANSAKDRVILLENADLNSLANSNAGLAIGSTRRVP
ncbi:MAG: uncharacterized protein JWM11_577, partial [Planctomycetaceae bacterium]|nr:uncharacterized protein [Planctomycetaceae bacterium]